MIHVGDALTILSTMPDESVHCIVTSPPYYGLRDYGTGTWEGGDPQCDHRVRQDARTESSTLGGGKATTGHQQEGFREKCPRCGARRVDQQLGLERTPDEYLAKMVAVFREARRVLRSDGTAWVNMGDSYIGGGRAGKNGQAYGGLEAQNRCNQQVKWGPPTGDVPGLKPKDLCGIPWRLALALQADGWYLRADIIWHKPNPMPESVTDRPTKAHEYIFLLSKSARYFYDAEAIREPSESGPSDVRKMIESLPRIGGKHKTLVDPLSAASSTTHVGQVRAVGQPGSRNARSVWTIATQPFPGAHFATFPEALAERCIRAGTSERGCCPECGAPWVRVVERKHYGSRAGDGDPMVEGFQRNRMGGQAFYENEYVPPKTIGWRPTCDHGGDPVPCTVGDIFGGAGTTLLSALKLNRRGWIIELKPEYAAMAERRIKSALPLFAEATR